MTDNQAKKKILFIINPISGNNKRENKQQLIEDIIDAKHFDVNFKYTEYSKHATEIAKQAVNQGVDIVVAVGGDGTVNEVSKALIGSETNFAIVPSGSGNGLGRFLKIPLKTKKAVEVINSGKSFKMDAIKINEEYFVNMAGVGFDAHISHLFSTYGKRGFRSYLKLILKEFFTYTPGKYTLKINGQQITKQAFVISFANSSQFGNNAHIAPLAEINDGLIDVCILKRFPAWKSLYITLLLYSKKLTKSKYYKIIKAREVEIINDKNLPAHIDGDPIAFDSNVKISIIPESLNVIIP
jgi:diacylglycerol kinase (ATP)